MNKKEEIMDNEGSTKNNYHGTIEEVFGISSSIAKKLCAIGYNTAESLTTASARELILAGLGEKKASEIIQIAREISLPPFKSVEELIKERKNISRLTTGCKELNELLGEGLETQAITEFYGEYGSGKSQFAHQLCVNVQLPLEQGGLEGGALYIDTENTFRIERISHMAKNLGLDLNKVFKNIIVAEAFTSEHQMFLLNNADKVIKENSIRLIVIDSLTSHFRSEYIGRENLAERQQKINQHMHKLIQIARVFNSVAFVTNQVLSSPDTYFGSNIKPIGGHIVAHTSHTRIFLRKTRKGSVRIARLVSSPYRPEGECIFAITENGIEDIKSK
jgi:DNA repair protein RadA